MASAAAPAVPCSPETALCLDDGRFEVKVAFGVTSSDQVTILREAHPVALTSNSGYFWFFDPDNVELAVKVLDGCGVNGHRWFFAAGMTNVEVKIHVTDTATGESRNYTNPFRRAFQPILDTAAFEGCTDGSASISGRNLEEPLEGVASAPPVREPFAARSSDLGCAGSDTALCVRGRFQVEAAWQTSSGESGPAYAVPLTSDSGYFWFFEPSNVELIVKVLDACSLDQGNWFFAAGMTNVGVELRVTDTYTGEARTFTNPVGLPFAPIQDTGGFAFCPTPTPTPTASPTRTPTPTATPTPIPASTPAARVTIGTGCDIEFARNPCFEPQVVHIRRGGVVEWTWSGSHSSTSGRCAILGFPYRGSGVNCEADGLWDLKGSSGTFRRTFHESGSFSYFCTVHHFSPAHEAGTVIVDP